MIKTLMGLVLITFAAVGAKTLFTESIKHVKTQFTNYCFDNLSSTISS